MAPCKAMILVGTLLLVTTLQMRIKGVNELTPDQPEEPMDQEELGEALVEEDVHKGLIGTAGEDAEEEAGPMAQAVPREDEQAAASRKVVERTVKLIQQGKEKGGKPKKGKLAGLGKDKGKGKGNDKGKDAGKGKENKLVKGKFKVNTKAQGKIIRQLGKRPERLFRYPVLNGKWWIVRLAFTRGQFSGFIYQEVEATKTLLVKSWKTQEEFGDEAIIPLWGNYVGAKVGDKITFDVGQMAQEGEGKPRPMATNVIIREREHAIGTGLILAPPPSDVRTQVLYYMSDENLRKDKFFQDIIAATEGGWISTDFLLLCRRLKQLGASTKSIIEGLRDAPGVEVRDMPGQEAIRRTSPPPPLDAGTVARKDVVFPSLEDQRAVKKMYTLEMMKSMGDVPVEKTMEKMLGQRQEELAKLAGPKGDEQERTLALAEAEGPESPEQQKDGPTRAEQAAKKALAESKKEEKAKERAKKAAVDKAAAKKAAAEKPAAKKALAEVGQAAAENSEEEKAAAIAKRRLLEQAAADEAATEQAAVQKAGEEAAAAPGAASDNQKSWGTWFSMLPRAAWGYLGLPVTTGNPGNEEKKAGEQDADDAKEQQ